MIKFPFLKIAVAGSIFLSWIPRPLTKIHTTSLRLRPFQSFSLLITQLQFKLFTAPEWPSQQHLLNIKRRVIPGCDAVIYFGTQENA